MILNFKKINKHIFSNGNKKKIAKNKEWDLSSFEKILKKYDINDELKLHLIRTSIYSEVMADILCVDKEKIKKIKKGALLHDIGKLKIDSCLLIKKQDISIEDFKKMQTHSRLGLTLLLEEDYDEIVEKIIILHHEAWNGNGYPFGLRGKDIPIEARIVAVANFYDKLVENYWCKKEYLEDEILLMLKENAGKEFDPDIIAIIEIFQVKLKVLCKKMIINKLYK